MAKSNVNNHTRQQNKASSAKLEMINPDTAFVDIGSGEHWVCIPEGRCKGNVRKFGAFTCDL